MASNYAQFTLSTDVEIGFDARDIVQNVTRVGVTELIMEVEAELNNPAATILLSRRLKELADEAAKQAPDLLALTNDELEDVLQGEDDEERARAEREEAQ